MRANINRGVGGKLFEKDTQTSLNMCVCVFVFSFFKGFSFVKLNPPKYNTVKFRVSPF